MKLSEFRYYRPLTVIQPQRVSIIIPEFSFPLPVWDGASTILGGMSLGNSYYSSFKLPIKPFGTGFVLAVTWQEGNIQKRFKLWEDVGEVLFYPVYSGEVIGLTARIEIWSVDSEDVPVNGSNVTLKSSLLAFPNNSCCSCCSNPDVIQELEVVEVIPCNPVSYCLPVCPT